MKAFRPEFPFYALIACTALITACTSPGYNNNPSQQITNARVGCLGATDFFSVYFSLHVQPSGQSGDARITRELFQSYCNDIPAPGKIFFTADLVGNELRKSPIVIRVTEQQSADSSEDAGSPKEQRTVVTVPPTIYSKGIIESNFELNKNGYYSIYLIRGGADSTSEEDKLKIPLSVGVDSSARFSIKRITAILSIPFSLALTGFVAFRYLRRRMVI
ncbi:hypothetical protein ABZN20_11165 [Methylococcus sp. ANG]|uniref:hypothetical protein n=1 Tax=Methylococcus sp. ANG TaxID=3231903 RepID=UPI00345AD85F